MKSTSPTALTNKVGVYTPRHVVWGDVSRKRPPVLTAKGRAARRRRWMAEYDRLSDHWRSKGDLDMAIYWAERASFLAHEEFNNGEESEEEKGTELR